MILSMPPLFHVCGDGVAGRNTEVMWKVISEAIILQFHSKDTVVEFIYETILQLRIPGWGWGNAEIMESVQSGKGLKLPFQGHTHPSGAVRSMHPGTNHVHRCSA